MASLFAKLMAERLLNGGIGPGKIGEVVLDHKFGPQMKKLRKVRKLTYEFRKVV